MDSTETVNATRAEANIYTIVFQHYLLHKVEDIWRVIEPMLKVIKPHSTINAVVKEKLMVPSQCNTMTPIQHIRELILLFELHLNVGFPFQPRNVNVNAIGVAARTAAPIFRSNHCTNQLLRTSQISCICNAPRIYITHR